MRPKFVLFLCAASLAPASLAQSEVDRLQEKLRAAEAEIASLKADNSRSSSEGAGDVGTAGLVDECPDPPYPTEAIGPVFANQLIDDFGDQFRVKLWRMPCTEQDSLAAVTLEPVSGTPFLCDVSSNVVQGGQQFGDVELLQDASDTFSGFCDDILVEQTRVIFAEDDSDNTYDMDEAFTFFVDGDHSFDVPDYDVSQYPGFGDVPPMFDFAQAEDSWVNPDTSGEGLFFDFGASLDAMFVAWFTFRLDAVQPMGPVMGVGSPDQRWMTALLGLDGNVASGTLQARRGEAFDTPPLATADNPQVGDIEIEFLACDEARVTYTIDSAGVSGEFDIIPLEKSVNPSGFECEVE